MLQVCCSCSICYGEKEPLEDTSLTHGFCDVCTARIRADIARRRAERVQKVVFLPLRKKLGHSLLLAAEGEDERAQEG